MKAFAALLKNDMRLFFGDWKTVLLLVAMPFLFICFFTYALAPHIGKSGFVEPFKIALVDCEDSAQTRILSRQLEEIRIFSGIERVSEDRAKELISQNKAAAAIVIPEGFSESVLHGENKPVTVIGNRAMPLESFIVKSLMQSAANLVSAGQSAINTVYCFGKKAGLEEDELEREFNESVKEMFLNALGRNQIFSRAAHLPIYDLSPAEYFTSALVAVFLMFAGMPAMKMFVMEKSSGLSKRLRASPVSACWVILSKFAVALSVSLIQFLIIIFSTYIAFGNYWGAPAVNILLLLAGILFAVASWAVFVASVCRTPAAVDAVGNLGILLMAVAGGSIYPLSSMPSFVRVLSKATINRWAMEGFMILFSGDRAAGVTEQVAALLAIGAGFLALSIGAARLGRSGL